MTTGPCQSLPRVVTPALPDVDLHGFSLYQPRTGKVPPMNPVHPKKLLLTKWTAVQPVARQKHFVVTKVIEPESPPVPEAAAAKIEWVDIEAVYSGKVRRIAWRELRDTSQWRQGWV